jgi:putative PIN family toxin of toxin-antitoxin system
MKCFIDSNILFSAGIFTSSVPAKALEKAITPPNRAFVSDYSLDEVHAAMKEKFPDKVRDFELFIYRTLFSVTHIITPTEDIEEESKVSDIKDRPILRAAMEANVDVLITGDKPLLATKIDRPLIITPADFLKL